MSEIIKAAAVPYELDVNTVRRDDTEMEIVLLSPQEPDTHENELAPADPDDLPTRMEIEFELTGNVNRPEDIGWQGEGDARVFQMGVTEVEDVILRMYGAETQAASEIVGFDTAGEWLSASVLEVTHALIRKEYIADGNAGQIVIRLPRCTAEQYAKTKELVSLMLEEAGLSLEVREVNGTDTLSIVPAEKGEPREEAEYTMEELMDAKLNKDIGKVTELQMRILSLAYTRDGALEKLRPRYWAVIPNFVGMSEEDAVALCTMSGFIPHIVYEQLSWGGFSEEDIGKVIYQDCTSGFAYEVGMGLQLNIVVRDQENTIQK
jgi:hypothetical protein